MILAYDGTNYVGWQTQPNGISVQETLERALSEVTKAPVSVHGSGRTDSGVHAAAQVAHFDTEARMAADKFAIALNMHLPSDIRVLFSEECDPSFHARFSAKRKQYRYRIHVGTHADVFSRTTALQLYRMPDTAILERMAAKAIGTHDFRAFMSSGTNMQETVRTVYESAWTFDGTFLTYAVTGSGFLYNMVRIFVGTMLDGALGTGSPTAFEDALASKNRADAGSTAPAHGLMLSRVIYDDFDTEEVLSRE